MTEDNLQQQLDAMDREAEQLDALKAEGDKQPQLQVTEMNEKRLTIQIKVRLSHRSFRKKEYRNIFASLDIPSIFT